MCLSTVVREKDGAEETIMKNVCGIDLADGRILLKDILGRQVEVAGTLKSLDFVNNIISVADIGK